MSDARFPQYATSSDPAVIEAILTDKANRADMRERAGRFSKKHGNPEGYFYISTFAGYRCTGIESTKEPASGRWKRTRGTTNGWLPYVSNPLHAEFSGLTAAPVKIPGVPELVHGVSDRHGSSVVATPTVFVLDGAAYCGISFPVSDPYPEAGRWSEIKASEFYAAMETYNERIKEATE